MTFLRILPRFSGNPFQISLLSLVGLLLVSLGSGCSDPATTVGSNEEGTNTETNASPVDIPVVSVGEETSEPESKPALAASKEVTKPVIQESKPAQTEKPKAAAPAVKFPEMKMSDHAVTVRNLFVEAQKQFTEERYVGAIQTLRKLDSMELGEKEEQAVDMFLKRIEKALSSQETSSTEDPKE